MARRRSRSENRPPADVPAALEIAYRYLATRPRTRLEVARRLRTAGADEELVEACLARLEALGYVDDAAFVRYWTDKRDVHSPRAARLIEAELRQRGVGRDVIVSARESVAPVRQSEAASTEAQRAAAALTRYLRGRTIDTRDARELKRAADFLLRRGFTRETSRAALDAVVGRSPAEEVAAFGEDEA